MKPRRKDKFFFKIYKLVLGPFFPKYKYEGIENVDEPCIIISNHVGATGPAEFSFYFPHQFKIWANGPYFDGLKSTFDTLYIYLHNKKKKSKFVSWILSVIGAPWFYWDIKISQAIPTYNDARFYITISKSIEELEADGVVILFPEYSDEGMQETMVTLRPGFAYLLDFLSQQGKNVPVVPAFINKKKKRIHFGEKINYQELVDKDLSMEEKLSFFANKMNELI